MSEEFKLEIVNPEQSFLLKEDVTEVVIPAFEGEMGILKDHISIISFLKPGMIKIFSKSGEENYYVEDGIVEFKNNNLSVLTSSIFDVKKVDKNKIDKMLKQAEEYSAKSEITDVVVDFKLNVYKEVKEKVKKIIT
jgi:F-type H+-transporting ATPase subunit epsilon/F-type H+-transporting ATPase subunit delta